MALTPRQDAFVREYLIDLNATQAAIRAGYSAKTAKVQGARLLTNVDIADAIVAGQSTRSERTEITADRVLRELGIIGFSDVRNFAVDDKGTLTLVADAPDEAWRAVSSVKHKIRTFTDRDGNAETNREIEFRLWDKPTALEKIAKHIRFYPPEQMEVTGKDGGPVRVAGADVDDLTDEQLAALAAQLAAKA